MNDYRNVNTSDPKFLYNHYLAVLKFCPVDAKQLSRYAVVLAHLKTMNLNFMLLLVRIVCN